MGDRATIAFCAADGSEWARIYIHNRGSDGRAVLDAFVEDEAAAIRQCRRDSRWHDPSYLAARFVEWNCSAGGSGLDVGIVPVDHEQRWHWRVICISEADLLMLGESKFIIEQVKPEPIKTRNDFLFRINTAGFIAPGLKVLPMNRPVALRTAAWLAVLADPCGEEFEAVLAAVRAT